MSKQLEGLTDAQRATYWKQRALSAEGALPVDACGVGARALHKRSALSGTPYEELTAGQRAGLEWHAHDVIQAVNGERLRRLPHDHPERAACWCHTCSPITLTNMRMILCPACGNKRCPRANDHRNACTNSNDPGQPGSAYPAACSAPNRDTGEK